MNKKIIYGLGALAVVGVAYYLYTNNNKPTDNTQTKQNFSGDYSNLAGRRSGNNNTLRTGGGCSGANGTQSTCPPCHRCLNGQCTALPPSVCTYTPSTR